MPALVLQPPRAPPRSRAVVRGARSSRALARRWVLAAVGVLIAGAALAIACRARPAYDASGWLVWGVQTLHGDLDLNAAPSWKPLSFLFTLPAALLARRTEMWCWIVISVAGSVAAPLMAGRLAWRLSPRTDSVIHSRCAATVAAVIAAGAVATMTVGAEGPPTTMGYLRQALILSSDPLALTFWLLAIDACLSRRHGWSLFCLWMVCLGRPEAWLFLLAYGVWLWLRVPALRLWVLLAVLSLALAWFLAPGLCSRSWSSAGNFDLGQATAIHGDKILGVLTRLRTLSGRAMQVEIGAGIVVCLIFRDRRAIAVALLGLLWTVIEVAFALHGFSAVQRYLIEAAAPLAIAGSVGVAYSLSWPLARLRRSAPTSRSRRHGLERLRRALCAGGVAALAGFAVVLVPFAHASVDAGRGVIQNQRLDAGELSGLNTLIGRAGGAEPILACGPVAGGLGWQSTLAFELGLNVGTVGYGAAADFHRTTVFFSHRAANWRLTVLDPAASSTGACRHLRGLAD